MKVGIVGHESSKFSPSGERQAKDIIINIAVDGRLQMKPFKSIVAYPVLVSGRCPIATCYNCHNLQYAPSEASISDPFICPQCGNLDAIRKGGIDIWAEQIWDIQGWSAFKEIKIPRQNEWNSPAGGYGFKARNLDIAQVSDEVHVILATKYPDTYTGMKFDSCYHCDAMPERWVGRAQQHPKSGACWTAIRAFNLGKPCIYHFV